jgi:hypothetical protein
MICVKLDGGLGNQMFQYAFGRMLSNRYGTKLLLDTSQYGLKNDNTPREYELSIFDIKASIASQAQLDRYKPYISAKIDNILSRIVLPQRLIKPRVIHERDNRTNLYYDNVMYVGFWQSEKYFDSINMIIRNEFNFGPPLSGINKTILEDIQKSASISLHVRRGDYQNNPMIRKSHGLCSLEYYHEAIDMIAKTIKEPKIFIFSDDMDWVKRNLHIEFPHKYIFWNGENKSYCDMQLMSYCKHNIIANSSFSWWGAWLNSNPEKIVVSPNKWFATRRKQIGDFNLIPNTWVKI